MSAAAAGMPRSGAPMHKTKGRGPAAAHPGCGNPCVGPPPPARGGAGSPPAIRSYGGLPCRGPEAQVELGEARRERRAVAAQRLEDPADPGVAVLGQLEQEDPAVGLGAPAADEAGLLGPPAQLRDRRLARGGG